MQIWGQFNSGIGIDGQFFLMELRNFELELKFLTKKNSSKNKFTIFTMLTLTCGVTIYTGTIMMHLLEFGVETPGFRLYSEGGHCQSVLRPQGFERPPFFLIIHWKRQRHLTWSTTHDVVSREFNLWKSFDLLRGSNL